MVHKACLIPFWVACCLFTGIAAISSEASAQGQSRPLSAPQCQAKTPDKCNTCCAVEVEGACHASCMESNEIGTRGYQRCAQKCVDKGAKCASGCPAVACGDGECGGTETYTSCPQDCPAGRCGDGICDYDQGENHSSCPQDCPRPVYCGDGRCNNGETHGSCPADCPKPRDPPWNCAELFDGWYLCCDVVSTIPDPSAPEPSPWGINCWVTDNPWVEEVKPLFTAVEATSSYKTSKNSGTSSK